MNDTADAHAMGIGSRAGPDELWIMARRDFLAGDSAAVVCKRYDLGKSTFWAKASAEGWRRADQDALPTLALDEMADLDGVDLSDLARLRLCQALMSGRSGDAAGWLRVYQALRQGHAQDELL